MEGTFEARGGQRYILAVQHLFAMFGATILVPALTGLNYSVALITAGLGTLLFHLITQKKVPVFLGSSFAFIPCIQYVVQNSGVAYAQGGIIIAGLLYALFAGVVLLIGVGQLKKLFPPVVTGPVIVVIGLTLSPEALRQSAACWPVAIFTLLVVVSISIFTKGFFKLVPILIGILYGYILCVVFDLGGITNFISETPLVKIEAFDGITANPLTWVNAFWKFDGTFFTLPKFSLESVLLIAPVAFVTLMEHIGDITTNGTVVGKDFFKDPGIHRTLLGDGLATSLAGLFGGPANTTYSENTGVLAVTKVYDPSILRVTAVFAVLLGLVRPFGAILSSMPTAVIGGVSILLFGMIASIGIRTMAESKIDFTHSRNLIVVALILVVGLGLPDGIAITESFNLSGLFLAVILGVLANRLLPEGI
ncbi:MAG: uracil-xanthine permease family protein [Clostridiales bacterium]|jgi:uracil permease|nr:uracil-xanthine permease family protein [Clostridiales bacterium]